MEIGRTKLEEIQVKPLRFYKEKYLDYDDIEVGDVVVAFVYNLKDNIIFLWVGNNLATMELNDYSNGYEAKNAKAVLSLVGRNVLARVKAKKEKVLILERKTIVEKTTEILKTKINDVVEVTVEWNERYGLFVDIGNGISSLIHANEVSKCWHNFKKDFYKGEILKVKILDYDPENNQFNISRKQAYEKQFFAKNEIVEVECSTPLKDGTGIFVEYDPANSGIMDIPFNVSPRSFAEGEKVLVMVKKTVNAGFRCTYWWHV